MDQKRVPLTVSLPPAVARKFQRMARTEAKNKSQLFRDMIRVYERHHLEEEFFELQHYGARQAREKGLFTEEDVEAVVFQDR